jgi:hypothetical protein
MSAPVTEPAAPVHFEHATSSIGSLPPRSSGMTAPLLLITVDAYSSTVAGST